jgi:carboxyl-terminal processing protease
MQNKKLQIWLPVIFALVMVWGMSIGYQLRGVSKSSNFFNSSSSGGTLSEVLDLIKNKYVDAVPQDSLNQAAINDVLSHLDPHSVYIPASDFRDLNDELMGNFEGIGIEFQLFNDTVNVVRVIKGGPSDKAGLQVGDKLLKANDSIILAGKKLNSEDIRKKLRGDAGSSIKITLLRAGVKNDFVITRGNIPISSIDAAYIIAPQTGYLRINKFADHTYQEFMQSMENLQKQGMKKLILDLRENGGGLLSKAVAIADEFLDDNKLIVYTQGNKSPRTEYRCSKDGIFETEKLVVLVDETTASASEVLSGALQDWDRATIIGRRTFGKGLVQQQYSLSDGSALRLTVARYYTPLGRNIQKPYNLGKEKYEEELFDRFQDGEVLKGDTAKPVGKKFTTPSGHIVYGGGGITPDLFVPLDTINRSSALMKLYYKATLNNFVNNYYVQHKQNLQSLQTAKEIEKNFNNNNNWNLLLQFAAKDSVQLININAQQKQEILQRAAALLARQITGTEGYFEIMNDDDKTVEKALDELK